MKQISTLLLLFFSFSATYAQTSGGVDIYCASKGNTVDEHIKTVAVGSINNTSNNNGGYGNYTNLSTNLTAGMANGITLTPGFTSTLYSEAWTVYIDYNQDGDFADAGETAATTGAGSTAVTAFLNVPLTAKNGATRMRIQMSYASASANPCATLSYGEVEDYTVNISAGGGSICVTPGGLTLSGITSASANLSWGTTGATSYNLQWKASSATAWTTVTGINTTSYSLTGLTAGTAYQFQVQSACVGTTGSYSLPVTFTTNMSCMPLSGLTASAITSSGAALSWSATGATSYNLQWKAFSESSWTTVQGITGTSYSLTGLTANTAYQFQVQNLCGGTTGSYSLPVTFTTDKYCNSRGNSTEYGFINAITLGSINNISYDNGGYGNYTNLSTTLTSGISNSIILTPSSQLQQGWTVYIDYNQDGDFVDEGEIAATGMGNIAITRLFTVPITAKTGPTRMRIQMKYGSISLDPCATIYLGEVEDYTVNILSSCTTPTGLAISNITNTAASLSWSATSAASYNLQWKASSASTWTTVTGIIGTSYSLTGLTASTAYQFQVQGVCGSITGSYSLAGNFTTDMYCGSKGSVGYEYIEAVSIGSVYNYSNNNGGYGKFTNLGINLIAETANSISLKPGFSSSSKTVYWTVYIDYNQDGDFIDAGETVLTGSGVVALNTSFTIPITAKSGTTRMRIQMRSGSILTDPCATFTNGEVEDYAINISTPPCVMPTGLTASAITNASAVLSWSPAGAPSFNLQWKASSASTWTTVTGINTTSYSLTGLTAGTFYDFRVQSVCGGTTPGAYTYAGIFYTDKYCSSKGNSAYEYIKTVTLANIDHPSTSDNGYGNYTDFGTVLNAGTTNSITLTPGFTGLSYTEYWTVYIDYNQDGDFADAGEVVVTAGGTAAITKSFTVPLTAERGSTRMRIQIKRGSASSDPCATFDSGEVEDYTVYICIPPPQLTVSATTASTAALSWTYTGAQNYYLQYKALSASIWTTISGITGNSYTLTGLTPSTTYQFRVQSVCSYGYVTNGNNSYSLTADFTTAGGSDVYCISRGISTAPEYINSVYFGTINNTSYSNGGYADFTNLSTNLSNYGSMTLVPGFTVPVMYASSYTQDWTVYIDYNQDGDFTDAGETVATGRSYGNPLNIGFMVPVTAKNGPTRMRIQMKYGSSTTDPCAIFDNGEVEDYTVNITCVTPTGLTASPTASGAALSWTSTGATSYNLQWKSSSATTWTTVSNLTATSYNLTGLIAGTAYQFQVQSVCSSTTSAYSAFASFTTSTGSTYCASKGATSTYEYIKAVALGSITNTSNNDNGYGNYTNLSTNLTAGVANSITLTPGFSSTSYGENWTVFIDYNQDGDFADAGETVATTGSSTAATTTSFTVPVTAKNGPTRMRIQMNWGSASTNPCATLGYGEVEDYTVNISGGSSVASSIAVNNNRSISVPVSPDPVTRANTIASYAAVSVSPNPVTGANAVVSYSIVKDGKVTLRMVDMYGRSLKSINLGMQTTGVHTYNLNNTKNLSSGSYNLVVFCGNEMIGKASLIVAK